jgi:hypothetical protein
MWAEGENMLRRSRKIGAVLVFFSLIGLFASLSKDRIAGLHGSDIVGLLGIGGCLGIGIAGLLGRLRIREE